MGILQNESSAGFARQEGSEPEMRVESTPKQLILSESAMRVLERRYLAKDADGNPIETPSDLFRRVARNIAAAEMYYTVDDDNRLRWEEAFYGIMTRQEFLPNSPTLMNAGTDIQQLSACFVLPVDDSMDGIFNSIKHTAIIHKSGGGTGFSFSRIRPRNDVVNSTKGVSSGPISFMTVFDAATETVKQGGRRRGANMAILRVDHPDILQFIDAKHHNNRLNNFNISVAVTDTFMEALRKGEEYDLINPRTGDVTGRLSAEMVFEKIIGGAWRNGEPGIVFIDEINRANPTPQIGPIESTNPCGEQPLLPYESCNLGSVNLSRFAVGKLGECTIDYERLGECVATSVRFLDNVIDMNRYPLDEIDALTKANRKIGLGVMGFADLLIRMGIPYDSDRATEMAGEVMSFIQEAADEASRSLADERGAFPNFALSAYADRGELPIRHATRTTIAPTGTISIIADTTSGVEPIFALAFVRKVMDNDELVESNATFEEVAREFGFYSEDLIKEVAKTGGVQGIKEVPERWRSIFKTSHDILPEAHIRIQAAFQRHTDNAVSKTVNFANDATQEDVRTVFELAFDLGCKGVTIYRDGSRESQVLNVGQDSPSEKAAAGAASVGEIPIPIADDRKHVKKPRKRPDTITGTTRKIGTGCGNLYVTINDDEHGAFELFAQIGKAGGCAASQTEAIGRLISLALRAGVDPNAIARQLSGVRCPSPAWNNGNKVFSCADGISKALAQHLRDRDTKFPLPDSTTDTEPAIESLVNRLAGMCMECGSTLEFESGCAVCRNCGYSRC
jgi:ribonucleoside-diphosphate reductase alpha chain